MFKFEGHFGAIYGVCFHLVKSHSLIRENRKTPIEMQAKSESPVCCWKWISWIYQTYFYEKKIDMVSPKQKSVEYPICHWWWSRYSVDLQYNQRGDESSRNFCCLSHWFVKSIGPDVYAFGLTLKSCSTLFDSLGLNY